MGDLVFIAFSRKGDVHASLIKELMAQLDHELLILEREEYGVDWVISSTEKSDVEVVISVGTRQIRQKDIQAVWLRANFIVEKLAFESLSVEENEYVAMQRNIHVNSCIRALALSVPFLNHPSADSDAQSKVLQVAFANQVGLRIPSGFRGGSPELFDNFLSRISGRPLCSKPLEASHLTVDGNTYSKLTRKLSHETAFGHKESLKDCPLIVQEYIDKSFEIRVTVVGEKIFACSIDTSSAGLDTQLDWRNYDIANTPHFSIQLPNELQNKILKFHRRMGLVYGAYDFIKTTDDEYVFLEVNSKGQWLWIEELTDMPISQAIADQLVELASKQ